MKNTQIIFIKNPILGKVKTRIAQSVGDETALDIYKQLLKITRDICLKENTSEKYLYYSHFIDLEDKWENSFFNKRIQKGNNLGKRMYSAFNDIFNQGKEKAILIGSDCPYINKELIQEGFKALDKDDIVLGPTFDGGYYLIGMKKPHDIFTGIQWSTETVLEQTISRCKSLSLSVKCLKQLSDIDYIEDWERYIRVC